MTIIGYGYGYNQNGAAAAGTAQAAGNATSTANDSMKKSGKTVAIIMLILYVFATLCIAGYLVDKKYFGTYFKKDESDGSFAIIIGFGVYFFCSIFLAVGGLVIANNTAGKTPEEEAKAKQIGGWLAFGPIFVPIVIFVIIVILTLMFSRPPI
jgi:hypothetical protein